MDHEFRLGNWRVQPQQNQITRGDERVRLDPRVMQVLVCLAERPGEIVPQEQIIEKVWAGIFVTDGALTNAIWELRKALGDDSANPRFIQTVPKKGYRLVAEVSAPEQIRRRRVLGAVATFVAVGGSGLYFWSSSRPSDTPRPARFVLRLSDGQRLPQSPRPFFALSPDGARMVYLAEDAGGRERLYHRALDEFEASPLPGTEGARDPFFSPDGEWVGFFKDLRLWKVAIDGGDPISVAEAFEGYGGTWGDDDTIVYQETRLTGLYRVRASGGTPQAVLPVTETGEMFFWPRFLPGERAILFTSLKLPDDATHIEVLSLDTGERRSLLEGRFASYASTGHLVYGLDGSHSLFAVPFDREQLQVRGKPEPILESVVVGPASAQFAISRNGTLVYLPDRGQQGHERGLVLVDREGNARPVTDATRHYDDPRFSPDGRRIAFASEGDIWTLDVTSRRTNRLTFNQESRLPVWSPDGGRILFRSEHDPEGLFVVSADGGSSEERLTSGSGELLPGSWSLSHEIIFEWDAKDRPPEIHVLTLQGSPVTKTLHTSGFGPRLSPDNRWLAYVWGTPLEVYVQRFPDGGGKWQVSSGGGVNPIWGPDGREIFYQALPHLNRIMAASIATEPAFSAGPPRLLFEYPDLQRSGLIGFPNLDISPDGKTFVVVKRPPPVTEFNVVLNWHQELLEKVPVR